MKHFLAGIFCCFSIIVNAQIYSRVEIQANDQQILHLRELGVAIEKSKRSADGFLIAELSEEDLLTISQNNIGYNVLIPDMTKYYVQQNLNQPAVLKNTTCVTNGGASISTPANFNVPTTYGGYFKYEEILGQLDAMKAAYPNLISTKAPIDTFTTWENRPIYFVRISNNPTVNDTDPNVMYTALHHSREPMSASQLIYYMWYLLENYASNPEVKFLVDNTQMLFIPCLNPDGYVHNQVTNPSGGGMHRKNRNPSVGTTNKGVDLNRNYAYGWGTTGVSTNVNNDTYPGTSAFSEPETKAIRWFVQNYTIKAAFNAHTHGDMILFPVGTTAEEFADHHDYFQLITNHMTQYNGYEATKSSGLYPASGDSDDYMYKMDNGVGVKDTMFSMTPEIGPSFWPPSNQIIGIAEQMLFPNLVLAHMVHKYYISSNLDLGAIDTVAGTFSVQTKKLGLKTGGATVSIQALQNIASVDAAQQITYNVGQDGTLTFDFQLVPTIQIGDTIKYVIITDDGSYIDRDTVVRVYQHYVQEVFATGGTSVGWTGNVWNSTSSTFYSPSQSYTDSPSGNYQNNANATYQLGQTIDLTNAVAANVTFYAKWNIEKDYDYCAFQVSLANQNNWNEQCGLYTVSGSSEDGSVQPVNKPLWDGQQTSWVQEHIDLSEYIGQQIKVRFILRSDQGTRADGFYFDDFAINVAYEEEGEPEPEPGENVGLENLAADAFKIYPNPTSGKVIIEGNLLGDRIEVIDIRGVEVFNTVVDHEKKMQLNLEQLSAGTYFIRIKSNPSAVKKIIVY